MINKISFIHKLQWFLESFGKMSKVVIIGGDLAEKSIPITGNMKLKEQKWAKRELENITKQIKNSDNYIVNKKSMRISFKIANETFKSLTRFLSCY